MQSLAPSLPPVRAEWLNRRAMESSSRIMFDIEEIGGAKVVVAALGAGVQAGEVNRDVYAGVRGIRLVEVGVAAKAGKAALDVRDHHMLGGKLN